MMNGKRVLLGTTLAAAIMFPRIATADNYEEPITQRNPAINYASLNYSISGENFPFYGNSILTEDKPTLFAIKKEERKSRKLGKMEKNIDDTLDYDHTFYEGFKAEVRHKADELLEKIPYRTDNFAINPTYDRIKMSKKLRRWIRHTPEGSGLREARKRNFGVEAEWTCFDIEDCFKAVFDKGSYVDLE